jgi:murein L,D-transpeptidase YcbB/YkuD
LALVLAVGCLPAIAAEPDAPAELMSRGDAIRMAVQDRLSAKFKAKSEAKKTEQGALVEFYSTPDARLLWVDENGFTDRGKAVMEEIAKADDYGLRASDYRLPNAESLSAGGAARTKALANAEIKISFAVLRYARDARGGRIRPQSLSPNLDPTLALPDPFEVIATIGFRSEPAVYLRSFQPDQPQFEALRKKLIELRGGSSPSRSDEPQVVKIPQGPTLRKGMEHEQVALLRKRLEIASDGGSNELVFDETVERAVKEFQASRGTRVDGLVGPGTRRLLNGQRRHASSPASTRSILVNMERWRWLPHDLGPLYVRVNIPEFKLRIGKDGEIIHTARAVVGKPDKQTPVFSDEMETVVFGPFWNVPNSIKVEELRPYVRANGGWLFSGGGWNTSVFQRHNLRIKYGGREVDPGSLDWNRIDIRTLHIYQPPGPTNVLGKVKFLFPNKHDVYMHDTPQKHLFAKQVRAESHGCMRIQNPGQLAAILLKIDQGWSRGRVDSALENGHDHSVVLRQKIPVYVTYFTTWVNEDGTVSTFRDLYGHDARMASALRLGGAQARDAQIPQPAFADAAWEWQRPWNR